VYFALDQTVALEAAQSLGEHFLRNTPDLALKRSVTLGAVSQDLDDERGPFICNAIEHEPRRALRIHNRADWGRLSHGPFFRALSIQAQEESSNLKTLYRIKPL